MASKINNDKGGSANTTPAENARASKASRVCANKRSSATVSSPATKTSIRANKRSSAKNVRKASADTSINLDAILFKCRDILRAARNSGSFFEKRDMMLTLVFLRFIGEKYEDGIENLRARLIEEGLDPDDENIRVAFYDDPTFTDGTYALPPDARWSHIINTPAPKLNVALDNALHSIAAESKQLRGCFVEGTFTTRNLAPNDIKALVDEVNKISHNLGVISDFAFLNNQHKGMYFDYIMANPPFNLKGLKSA